MIESYNEIVRRIILNDKNMGNITNNTFDEVYSSIAGWKEFTDKAKCKLYAEGLLAPRDKAKRRDATKIFYEIYKNAVPEMEKKIKKMEEEIAQVQQLPLEVRDKRVDKWQGELYDARKRFESAKVDFSNLQARYNEACTWEKKKFTDQWFNKSQRSFRNLCENMTVINQEKKKIFDERLWSDIKKGLLAPSRNLVLLLIKFNVLGLGTVLGKIISLSSDVKEGIGRIWERFGGDMDVFFKTIEKGKDKKILFNKGMENQSDISGMIEEIKYNSDAGDIADKMLTILPIVTTAFDCATNQCKETPFIKTSMAIIKPMLYVVKLGDKLGEKLKVINDGLDKAIESSKNYTPPTLPTLPKSNENPTNNNINKSFDINKFLKILVPTTLLFGAGVGIYYLNKN